MSKVIDKYLGVADHAKHDFQKTLEGLGISTVNAGYTGTIGNNQFSKVIEEFMEGKTATTLKLAIKGGSASVGATIEIIHAGKDANGKELFQAAAVGAGTTYIADSIASVAARCLAGLGAASTGTLVMTEVVVSLHATTMVKEAGAHIGQGLPNILGGTRWSEEDIYGIHTLTSGWSLQDMFNENMYETIFIHGDRNLKNIYEEGKSFKLQTLESNETYLSYDAESNTVDYRGTSEQANTIANATINGQTDIGAMVTFFDSKEFMLHTTTGEYRIFSIEDLSYKELAALGRKNEAVFDALMNTSGKHPYIVSEIPDTAIFLEPNEYSDTYLEQRAKFLKQIVRQENELSSSRVHSYTDNETGTRSYNNQTMMYYGDKTYFGGHKGKVRNEVKGTTNYLFGTRQGNNTADILKGSDGEDYIEGLDGNDIIYGGRGKDIIDGGSGDDILHGGLQKGKEGIFFGDYDILRGGTGNDTLYGGRGRDRLEGGKDYDTYHAVDGNVIMDSDAQGKIYFKGQELGKIDIGKYTSEKDGTYTDGTFNYTLNAKQELKVKHIDSGDSITIENFHENDLGINLKHDLDLNSLSGNSSEEQTKEFDSTAKAEEIIDQYCPVNNNQNTNYIGINLKHDLGLNSLSGNSSEEQTKEFDSTEKAQEIIDQYCPVNNNQDTNYNGREIE